MTDRTRPIRTVERKRTRFKFLEADRAISAGILLRIKHLDRFFVRRDLLYADYAATVTQGGFNGVGQSGADIITHYEPVDHRLNRVSLIAIQFGHIVNRHHLAINPHTHKALFTNRFKNLLMTPLASTNQRGEENKFGRWRQCDQNIDNLLGTLF